MYKASCWDCDSFYVGKTKRRLHDRKTEHFKALTQGCHASALADHVISTGHNIKWDHFDILATGKSDERRGLRKRVGENSPISPPLDPRLGSNNFVVVVVVYYLVTEGGGGGGGGG